VTAVKREIEVQNDVLRDLHGTISRLQMECEALHRTVSDKEEESVQKDKNISEERRKQLGKNERIETIIVIISFITLIY
jgi:hypothetical protein